MIIPPNALFYLDAKTILNKWKATVKKKKFFLTYLQLVSVVEEKRERGKMSNTLDHDLKSFTQSLFFLCKSSKKSIKWKKKNVSLWKK